VLFTPPPSYITISSANEALATPPCLGTCTCTCVLSYIKSNVTVSRGITPKHYTLLVDYSSCINLYLRFKNKSTAVLHLQCWLEIHFLSVRQILLTSCSVFQEILSPAPDGYNIPSRKSGVIRGVGHGQLLKYNLQLNTSASPDSSFTTGTASGCMACPDVKGLPCVVYRTVVACCKKHCSTNSSPGRGLILLQWRLHSSSPSQRGENTYFRGH
jgi:hypothetical protein